MNLSTKQIAQVIAPYIGQDMITTTRQTQGEGKPSKYLKGKFLEVDLGMVDSFIGVLLENETEPSNHTNYNIHEAKLILKPLSEISDEDVIELAKILREANPPYAHTSDKREDEIKKNPLLYAKKSSIIYQFLQSKGYDLPHFLLGGKTLHESGLATYKKE